MLTRGCQSSSFTRVMAPMASAKLPSEKSLRANTPYQLWLRAQTAPTEAASIPKGSSTARLFSARRRAPGARHRATSPAARAASPKGSTQTPSSRQSQPQPRPAPASTSQPRLFFRGPAQREQPARQPGKKEQAEGRIDVVPVDPPGEGGAGRRVPAQKAKEHQPPPVRFQNRRKGQGPRQGRGAPEQLAAQQVGYSQPVEQGQPESEKGPLGEGEMVVRGPATGRPRCSGPTGT